MLRNLGKYRIIRGPTQLKMHRNNLIMEIQPKQRNLNNKINNNLKNVPSERQQKTLIQKTAGFLT